VAFVGHGLSRHAPAPDTAAYTRSATVRRLDQATATWFSGQFRQLGDQASWLRPAGQSVLDYCDASGTAAAFSGPASWSLSCQRSQVRYYAYGGASASRLRQLERALTRQGWGAFTVVPATPAPAGQPASLPMLIADFTDRPSPVPKIGLQLSWISPAAAQALKQDIGMPVATSSRVIAWTQVTAPNLSQITSALTPQRDSVLIVTLRCTYAARPA